MARLLVGAAALGAGTLAATLGGLLLRLAQQDGGGDDDGRTAGLPVLRGPRASMHTGDDRPDEVSLISYNVLADVFAARLGGYAAPEVLDWGTRFATLQQQIAAWGADLVCLQEVDVTWLPDWLAFASSVGYAAIHQQPRGKQVVCMTLYRPDKLSLVWCDDARSRTLLGGWSWVDSSGGQQLLHVVNCHLEGSPHKPAERLRQLRSGLAALEKQLAAADTGAPARPPPDCIHVVVAGDLNSGRREACVVLLRDGLLPAGYAEAHLPSQPLLPPGGGDATIPFLLADAYRRHPLPFTRKVPALASCLDWLFVSMNVVVTELLWPLDDADAADRRLPHSRTGLPTQQHPSDHLPIGATLRCLPAAAVVDGAAAL